MTYWNCMLVHVHYVGSIKFYKLAKLSKIVYICILLFVHSVKVVLLNYCSKTTAQNLQTGLLTSGRERENLVQLPCASASVSTSSVLVTSTQHNTAVPWTCTETAKRAFCVAAPNVWNSLPNDIRNRNASSLSSFRAKLKTHFHCRISWWTSMHASVMTFSWNYRHITLHYKCEQVSDFIFLTEHHHKMAVSVPLNGMEIQNGKVYNNDKKKKCEIKDL